MLPKCFYGQYLFRNFIIFNNVKFHSIGYGLRQVAFIHQENLNFFDFVATGAAKPVINGRGCAFANETLKNIISKLSNYSKQYINWNTFPDHVKTQAYTDLLQIYVEGNDVGMVDKIICKEGWIDAIAMKEAREFWYKGKITESYDLFTFEYNREGLQCQQEILKTLRILIFYSIRKKGKAVLQDVIEGALIFSNKNQEFSLVVCVWFALFTSEMYEDWCIGEQILIQNLHVLEHLEKYVPWLGYLFLMNNHLTNYQRLIETALQFNMDNSVAFLLRNLFTYYYRSGYYDGCFAVYNCCKSLDVKLTQDQEYKYAILKLSAPDVGKVKLEILKPNEVKYKF